ncbi:hypothetical protein Lnau_1966 [Legionella nautarum]|uniref:Nucleotidyl transferase AbiEii toxin, Type IV TA system n=1 Tax=Legionella nautarum TaxID=45070 RepID=A0A0W0WS00_9GAMM|nr:hypothetical protein [Legionella nautarum]KTD35076.1 hypothetical protein Lnau_1966 [Legionella nautarum]
MQTKFEQEPSLRSAHSTEYLKLIAQLITSVFLFYDQTATSKISPIVQGSMGLLLHGVDFPKSENPADIDIVVAQQEMAQRMMFVLADKLKTEGSIYQIQACESIGPKVVYDFDIIDTSGKHPDLKIQLLNKEDFGLSHVSAVEKEGIPVLPAREAFISLEARIEQAGSRKKDKYAYFTLLDIYGEEYIKDSYFITTGKSRELKDYLELSMVERHRLRDTEEAPTRRRAGRRHPPIQNDLVTVPTIRTQQTTSYSHPNPMKVSQQSMFKSTSPHKQEDGTKEQSQLSVSSPKAS